MNTSVTYFMKFFTAQTTQTVFPQPKRGSRCVSVRCMEVEQRILRSHHERMTERVTGGIGYASEHHLGSGLNLLLLHADSARSWQSLGGLVVRLHGFGPASGIGSATHVESGGLCVVILIEAFCGCPQHIMFHLKRRARPQNGSCKILMPPVFPTQVNSFSRYRQNGNKLLLFI